MVIPVMDEAHQFVPEARQMLVEAVLSLIKDENLRLQLGQAGRQFILDNFSQAIQGERLAVVFNRTLMMK